LPRAHPSFSHAPPRKKNSWKVSRKEYDAIVASTGDFEPESLSFMSKVLHRSGLGDETYAPPSLTNVPMSLNMAAARAEFEAVAFGAVKDLLNKANVSPKQVGIVITNSSLFNTTPSLSAAIMNHFKMGSNTINYNLGGMGCSGEGGLGPGGSFVPSRLCAAPPQSGPVDFTALPPSACPAAGSDPPPSPQRPSSASRRDRDRPRAPAAGDLPQQLRHGGVDGEPDLQLVGGGHLFGGGASFGGSTFAATAEKGRGTGPAATAVRRMRRARAGQAPSHSPLPTPPRPAPAPAPAPGPPRYPGTSRGMLVTNTIFRVGGAAMLFSNKAKDSWCAARTLGGRGECARPLGPATAVAAE
jgi:hypothetical protein